MKRPSSCRSLSSLLAVPILSALLVVVHVVFDPHNKNTAPCFTTHAFTLAPQPAGLPPNLVADLARKRYEITERTTVPRWKARSLSLQVQRGVLVVP